MLQGLFVSRRYEFKSRFCVGKGMCDLLGNPEGLSCSCAELEIAVLSKLGETVPLRFFLDTGADMMVIPLFAAQYHGIAFSKRYPGTLASRAGGTVTCWYDFVRVQSTLSGKTHRWPCAFADSIHVPLVAGRAGLLDDFTLSLGNRHLVVSYPTTLRRALKHYWQALRHHGSGQVSDDWPPI